MVGLLETANSSSCGGRRLLDRRTKSAQDDDVGSGLLVEQSPEFVLAAPHHAHPVHLHQPAGSTTAQTHRQTEADISPSALPPVGISVHHHQHHHHLSPRAQNPARAILQLTQCKCCQPATQPQEIAHANAGHAHWLGTEGQL